MRKTLHQRWLQLGQVPVRAYSSKQVRQLPGGMYMARREVQDMQEYLHTSMGVSLARQGLGGSEEGVRPVGPYARSALKRIEGRFEVAELQQALPGQVVNLRVAGPAFLEAPQQPEGLVQLALGNSLVDLLQGLVARQISHRGVPAPA